MESQNAYTCFCYCDMKSLDKQILMPLIILHDVGYAKISSGNPFDSELDR